jgi:hypothetical protein
VLAFTLFPNVWIDRPLGLSALFVELKLKPAKGKSPWTAIIAAWFILREQKFLMVGGRALLNVGKPLKSIPIDIFLPPDGGFVFTVLLNS